MADINVSGVRLTEQTVAKLAAVIDEIRDYGSGWRVLDDVASAVWDALPAEVTA
jgi:hypothetical protein